VLDRSRKKQKRHHHGKWKLWKKKETCEARDKPQSAVGAENLSYQD